MKKKLTITIVRKTFAIRMDRVNEHLLRKPIDPSVFIPFEALSTKVRNSPNLSKPWVPLIRRSMKVFYPWTVVTEEGEWLLSIKMSNNGNFCSTSFIIVNSILGFLELIQSKHDKASCTFGEVGLNIWLKEFMGYDVLFRRRYVGDIFSFRLL